MPFSPNIASSVARILLEQDEGAVVSDVRIGLGYTGVMLDDNRAGVAYTFREEAKGGCSVFQKLRPLSGRHSSELVALLPSNDLIEVAVGLACANALVNVEDARFQTVKRTVENTLFLGRPVGQVNMGRRFNDSALIVLILVNLNRVACDLFPLIACQVTAVIS